MSLREDYEILKSKYNKLVARVREMEKAEVKRHEADEAREKTVKRTEKLTRKLCETVLKTDKNESKHGKHKSWDEESIDELLTRSETSLKAREDMMKNLMNKLLSKNEERAAKIRDLEDEIKKLNDDIDQRDELIAKQAQEKLQMQSGSDDRQLATAAGVKQKMEEDRKKKEREEAEKRFRQKRPDQLDDDDEVEYEDDDDEDHITVDPEDGMDDVDEKDRQTAASIKKSESYQVRPGAITIKDAGHASKKEEVIANKDRLIMENIQEDYAELLEIHIEIIKIIGSTGCSLLRDIMKHMPVEYNETAVRRNLATLSSKKVLKNFTVNIKTSGRGDGLSGYYLTEEKGQPFYKAITGQPSVESEYHMLCRVHDNAIHGYGIKLCAEEIIGKSRSNFTSVDYTSRKVRFKTPNNSEVIPDILCTRKDGSYLLIEYECANHTENDFNLKCNKYASLPESNGVISFIVQNDKILDKLKKQVFSWFRSKGKERMMNLGVKVRITTVSSIKDNDLDNDSTWKLILSGEDL